MPDGSFNVTKTNLDVLIAHLEEVAAAGEEHWLDPETGRRAKFYMGSWVCPPPAEEGNDCGTAACIAGHAALLADPVRFWRASGAETYRGLVRDVSTIAQRWLGISEAVAYMLFHGRDPRGNVFHFESITVGEAIETLRRFRDTGRVDWSHAAGYQSGWYRRFVQPISGSGPLSGTYSTSIVFDMS